MLHSEIHLEEHPQAHTVLIIDDEPVNILLLQDDLEDAGFHVLSASDGQEGWDVLQQHREQIKAIVVDRMMPNMDGIQFTLKLKADISLNALPVIMLTAAALREQVVEGIQAGVYYYLTKPYNNLVVQSIVRAAVIDFIDKSKLQNELKIFKRRLHIFDSCNFSIQTLEDSNYLSTFLANFFPDPQRVVTGISELLINAIEHGNLGISYDEKTKLNQNGTWHQEIERRLQLPEHEHKRAKVTIHKTDEVITLTIRDEGKGFDWSEYIEISASRVWDNHGRGIALSNLFCFDKMEYRGCGNEVICTVFVTQAEPIDE